MKKILALVLVMAVSVMAGTVTFSGVDNGDGTVTISADAPIVGMALDVDSDMDVTAVALDSFFDVFMDYAYDQGPSYVYGEGAPIAAQDAAGVATLPSMSFCISAGGLEDDGTDTVPATSDIVLTVDGTGDVVISENTLRGGVVDYDGAMTTNLPITVNVAGTVTVCLGDLDEDGDVDLDDYSAVATKINNAYFASLTAAGFDDSGATAAWYAVGSGDAAYDAAADMDEDGDIDLDDFSAVATIINNAYFANLTAAGFDDSGATSAWYEAACQ